MSFKSPTTTRRWADTPIPLIPTPQYQTGKTDQYTVAASQMAVVHNAFIRGYNSIHLQAANVQPRDYKSFIEYAYAWYEGLSAHHRGEEDMLFPEIEKALGVKGLMDENVAQHKAFHDGLGDYCSYLVSLRGGRESTFSGTRLISIMDSFGPALQQHLVDEIPTLLSLSTHVERTGQQLNLAELLEKDGEEVMGTLSMFGALPCIFVNHDLMFEGGLWRDFPAMPKLVRWMMMHVFTWWNQGWWKFASCDTYGTPKELFCS